MNPPPFNHKLFITASMHRIHHASSLKYLDKNMGMVFSFLDHLFGTYQAEDSEEKVIYGLVNQKKHYLPLGSIDP